MPWKKFIMGGECLIWEWKQSFRGFRNFRGFHIIELATEDLLVALFQTALPFEPSCLWIRHQSLQTKRFNARQYGLNSIQPLLSFRTFSVKAFPKISKITRILAFLFILNDCLISQKFQRKCAVATF